MDIKPRKKISSEEDSQARSVKITTEKTEHLFLGEEAPSSLDQKEGFPYKKETEDTANKKSLPKNLASSEELKSSESRSKFWRVVSEKKNPAFHLFLYLTLFISLSFLLFGMIQAGSEIVNRQMDLGPQQDISREDFFDQTELSWALAFLAIAIPIFYFLDWLIQWKIVKKEIALSSWVRKVLLYLALVVLVIILIGASISLVFGYFDARLVGRSLGRQLVFWLVILFFSGYQFWEARRTREKTRWFYLWWGGSLVMALAIFFWGSRVSDSPQVVREKRADQKLVSQIQQEQREIDNFYQKHGRLPFISDQEVKITPKVEYKRLGNENYELCASFNLPTDEDYFQNRYYYSSEESEKWKHSAGRHCFELEAPLPNNNPGNQIKSFPPRVD